jgi:hypothetical protein
MLDFKNSFSFFGAEEMNISRVLCHSSAFMSSDFSLFLFSTKGEAGRDNDAAYYAERK